MKVLESESSKSSVHSASNSADSADMHKICILSSRGRSQSSFGLLVIVLVNRVSSPSHPHPSNNHPRLSTLPAIVLCIPLLFRRIITD
ncbi:hypothetical protein K443DRAFT_177915 [Laccaria amethystina LaAM-08-1]|uniref:Uncharacterized protein n=1 Tax=Laccaria amethystina LaAM-08-1 TaxID=1095629 RepID=A0A0C9WNL1_9AGAR|nr:hypothetical protein K443DRAFT_177915 [Laccaria amethystina LaAM-08-1]